MKIDVPFFTQDNNMNCGPVALQMVFSFFKKDFDLREIEAACDFKESAACGTIQLATGAAKLGFPVELYSKSISFNEENLNEDYYKKFGGQDLFEKFEEYMGEAKGLGVKMEERTLTLDELLEFVKDDSVPIVLVNWNIVKGAADKGYWGHFLSVVGYDEKFVYVHNPGPIDAREFVPIPRDIFESARRAIGTDEDVLVVRKL